MTKLDTLITTYVVYDALDVIKSTIVIAPSRLGFLAATYCSSLPELPLALRCSFSGGLSFKKQCGGAPTLPHLAEG
jgi:hypothetical protein